MTQIRPPLQGPTEEDYERAGAELFPDVPVGKVWTDEQRKAVTRRAREFFYQRQTKH